MICNRPIILWDRDITGEDLLWVLTCINPIPSPLPMPGKASTEGVWNRRNLGLDCHEVHPDLFIGDELTVRDKQYLKLLRITHVVNCAEGQGPAFVSLSQAYFRDADIAYLGLPVKDHPSANIQDYFQYAADYIDCAIYNGGRVFLNCVKGVSRSATIAMAFLMLKRGMSGYEAVRAVRRVRDVYPNIGFLRRLAELHNTIRRLRCPQPSIFYLPEPYASIGAPLLQP